MQPADRLRAAAFPLAGVIALVTLVVGVDAGLQRLDVGVASESLATKPHGALMVSGFVGTLITLERARASDHATAMLVPFAAAAGALVLAFGSLDAGRALFIAAAIGLALVMGSFWRLQHQLPLLLGAAGALAWAGASIRWWMEDDIRQAIPWWAAFLALTIVAERLELTRFARRSTRPVLGAAVLVVVALAWSIWDWEAGVRAMGVALLATGLWLYWADTARVSVRRGDRATFIGLALLAAYAWLTLAGLLMLVHGLSGDWYDGTLHAYFAGFVLGAIFAHGPIILPALTGRPLRLTPLLYVALAVLHGSVAIRLIAGLTGEFSWRQTGALLHVAALLLYASGIALGLLLARRKAPQPPRPAEILP